LVLSTFIAAGTAAAATPLGANKFDLLLQYEGYSDYSDRSDVYRHVTQAMARKAIWDAKDAGFTFMRVSVSGYGGNNPQASKRDMLRLWQSDPGTYWHRVDEMLDELDRADLRIVPTLLWHFAQFPALTGETSTDFIRNPSSASRALAARYIKDFVTRYKARKTILFYELTNEYNLHAGRDILGHCVEKNDAAKCASIGNFTQDDLNGFAHDMAALIHGLDSSHQISSGYAEPPPNAYHLGAAPEWTKSGGFKKDSPAEYAGNLQTIHRDFDIVSVHIYPHDNAIRFGRPPGSQAEMLVDAAKAAHDVHKKLYLGEFGDSSASPFMHRMKELLDADTADYASIWVWEFYQTSTYETLNTEPTSYSLEPGFRDELIALFRRPPATPDRTPRPRIVLTWPLPCSHVGQPVQITAMASDGDRPVSGVDFEVDGAPVGSATTPPYRLNWDPAGKPAHLAHLKVVARSESKSTAADAADVLLNGAGEACSVTAD
jgi:hypothetical protein